MSDLPQFLSRSSVPRFSGAGPGHAGNISPQFPTWSGELSEEEKSASVRPQSASEGRGALRKTGESGAIVTNTNDSQVLDFARRLRSRFGQGVRLTYHATPEQTQGRKPYWWGVFE